jgi:TonB family protein
MVLPDGRPKIMDFGVARVESSQMTKAGEVLGSPSYMAPEQIAGHEVTARADLFSFAAVAYQALTGQKPFQGESITTVIYRVVHEDPPPPRSWNPALPSRYDEVFRKALAKDPAARFASAQAFVAALDLREFDVAAFAGLDGTPAAKAEPEAADATVTLEMESMRRADKTAVAPPVSSRRALWPWAAGALVLAAVIGGWLVSRRPPPPPPAPAAGSLRVETDPPGAAVSVDGHEVGIAPLTVPSVAPGSRTVRVSRDGYAPAELSFEVAPDVPIAPLRFSLTPTESKAVIHSEPSGATVTIDGRDAGRTPLDDVRLLPGFHEVRVESPGRRPWRQRVEARAGEDVSVEARLAPLPELKQATIPTPEPTPPPLKEGDLVELGPGVTSPRRISGSSAGYPAAAEKAHLEGTVAVDMVVTETGEPVELRIVESAGEILDKAVLDAVKTWRFEPARKNGIKVRVHWPARQQFRISR